MEEGACVVGLGSRGTRRREERKQRHLIGEEEYTVLSLKPLQKKIYNPRFLLFASYPGIK